MKTKRSQHRADARNTTFSNVPSISSRIALHRKARLTASARTRGRVMGMVITVLALAWIVGQLLR